MTLTVLRVDGGYHIYGDGHLLAVSPDHSSAWAVLFALSMTEHGGRIERGTACTLRVARELLANADAAKSAEREVSR